MGGGSSKPQTQSSTTSQESNTSNTQKNRVPDYAMPYAEQGLLRSQSLGQQPYAPYPYYSPNAGAKNPYYTNVLTGEQVSQDTMRAGMPFTSTVAPLNDQQRQSMGTISAWSNNPNPLVDAATGGMTDTLQGKYLNPQSNPYLTEYAQQAMGDVTRNYQNAVVPQINAGASRAGAFGGSAHELLKGEAMNNLGSSLAKTATGIYSPAYEAERTRMLQGQALAPTTAQMPVQQAMSGLGVGDVYQQQNQQDINSLLSQQQQAVQWPYMTQQQSLAPFQTYGWGSDSSGQGWASQQGTSYGTATPASSGGGGAGGILGGALGGAGTGAMIGSVVPGIGTGLGALGGGLLGAMTGLFK